MHELQMEEFAFIRAMFARLQIQVIAARRTVRIFAVLA